MICPIDNKRCYVKEKEGSDGGVLYDQCRHGRRYRDGALCPAQQKYGLMFERKPR